VRDGGRLRLTSPIATWPVPQAAAGDHMMLHPGLGYAGSFARTKVAGADGSAIVIAAPAGLTGRGEKIQLVASGPRSREEAP
jgi:hypothetical protein